MPDVRVSLVDDDTPGLKRGNSGGLRRGSKRPPMVTYSEEEAFSPEFDDKFEDDFEAVSIATLC